MEIFLPALVERTLFIFSNSLAMAPIKKHPGSGFELDKSMVNFAFTFLADESNESLDFDLLLLDVDAPNKSEKQKC